MQVTYAPDKPRLFWLREKSRTPYCIWALCWDKNGAGSRISLVNLWKRPIAKGNHPLVNRVTEKGLVRPGFRGNCTLNQNWACFVHYLEANFLKSQVIQASWSKLSDKHKNGVKILGQNGSGVIDQNTVLYILINRPKSRTACPTEILMPIFSFSDTLLQESHIVLQKS